MHISERTYAIAKRHAKLLEVVPANCPLITFGGWAVDCYAGKITRDHPDVDYLCPRKQINELEVALGRLDYPYELCALPSERNFFYKLITTDKDHTFTFHIVDKLEKCAFEMSLYHFPHYIMSSNDYRSCPMILEGYRFNCIPKDFLLFIKQREVRFREDKRSDRLEHDVKYRKKHENAKHDVLILTG